MVFRLLPALIGPSMARHAADESLSIEWSADFGKGQQFHTARNLNLAGVHGGQRFERRSGNVTTIYHLIRSKNNEPSTD